MLNLPELVNADTVAAAVGCNRNTAIRVMRANPGFSTRFGARLFVPRAHLERLLHGESPEQIAASNRNEQIFVPAPDAAVAR